MELGSDVTEDHVPSCDRNHMCTIYSKKQTFHYADIVGCGKYWHWFTKGKSFGHGNVSGVPYKLRRPCIYF